MFLQNVRTGLLNLGVSSILPYKVFGKRLVKNRRILRYTKARLQGTPPPLKLLKFTTFSQILHSSSNNTILSMIGLDGFYISRTICLT